jgi:hypothetical protein
LLRPIRPIRPKHPQALPASFDRAIEEGMLAFADGTLVG